MSAEPLHHVARGRSGESRSAATDVRTGFVLRGKELPKRIRQVIHKYVEAGTRLGVFNRLFYQQRRDATYSWRKFRLVGIGDGICWQERRMAGDGILSLGITISQR